MQGKADHQRVNDSSSLFVPFFATCKKRSVNSVNWNRDPSFLRPLSRDSVPLVSREAVFPRCRVTLAVTLLDFLIRGYGEIKRDDTIP